MASNNPNLAATRKPFVKGDPRINRKGRPKNFDKLRALAQLIANEDTDSGLSQVEVMMRTWAVSRDPRLQQAFIEYAYGKVPTQTEVTGANGTAIRFIVEKDEGVSDGG